MSLGLPISTTTPGVAEPAAVIVDHFAHAKRLFDEHKLEDALTAAHQALAQKKKVEIYLLCSQIHFHRNEFEKAARALTQAIRLNPLHAETCCQLSYALWKTSRFAAAAQYAEKALSLAANDSKNEELKNKCLSNLRFSKKYLLIQELCDYSERHLNGNQLNPDLAEKYSDAAYQLCFFGHVDATALSYINAEPKRQQFYDCLKAWIKDDSAFPLSIYTNFDKPFMDRVTTIQEKISAIRNPHKTGQPNNPSPNIIDQKTTPPPTTPALFATTSTSHQPPHQPHPSSAISDEDQAAILALLEDDAKDVKDAKQSSVLKPIDVVESLFAAGQFAEATLEGFKLLKFNDDPETKIALIDLISTGVAATTRSGAKEKPNLKIWDSVVDACVAAARDPKHKIFNQQLANIVGFCGLIAKNCGDVRRFSACQTTYSTIVSLNVTSKTPTNRYG